VEQATLNEEEIRESVTRAAEPEGEDSYQYQRLDSAALIGLAGEFIELVAPHTEADPVALLMQFLASTGNAVGRTAYYEVEATKHCANIFAVAVGPTASARKGTSWAHVRRVMSECGSWPECVKSGLSSGEGVIHAVRDRLMRREAVKEKGRVVEYEEVEADAGVSDKRLTIHAPEFSQALKVAARETNILSETIRQAWDSGDLRILNKNTPETATGAHISIIAHISKVELLNLVSETDCASGGC
jgi:hypothetical protein